ncbi:hypothetical protein FB451DRAFT_1434515 [Mycena latifolia]|nr:hypothetical protein FB451DRAFT_1434515 [Mycena latifolia]
MGLLDTGAQIGAMDKTFYLSKGRRLGKITASPRWLKMADGNPVVPYRRWEGELELEGVCVSGVFDIFDSGGGWTVLVGKPLQAALGVVHDVKTDVVTICAGGKSATLTNQNPSVWKGWLYAALEAARREASTGVKSCETPPARRVPSNAAPETIDPHPDTETAQVAFAEEEAETGEAVTDGSGIREWDEELDGDSGAACTPEGIRSGDVQESTQEAVEATATRGAAPGRSLARLPPRAGDTGVRIEQDASDEDDKFDVVEEIWSAEVEGVVEDVSEEEWMEGEMDEGDADKETRSASTGVTSFASPPTR